MDSEASTETMEMDINRIMELIPHRYPFLLIDRIIDAVPGERGIGIKNVTINEPFFQGHFPGHPIMPGVLIVEAMAQAAGVLAVESMDLADSGKLVYFMSIDGAKFRSPVEPGCLLDLHVEVTQNRGAICKFSGKAMIEGKLASEANFVAMITDPPQD